MSSGRIGFVIGAIAAGIVLMDAVVPACSRFFPPCMFHELTGLYCPGCGSTRALHALTHGDVAGAVRFNPLAVTVLAAFGVCACWQRVRTLASRPWFAWSVVTIVVVFGIVRNIPAYPFVMLKP